MGKLKQHANEELHDVEPPFSPPLSNDDSAATLELRQGLMQEQVR